MLLISLGEALFVLEDKKKNKHTEIVHTLHMLSQLNSIVKS